MGEELKAWVADALHAVAGFSSSSVASYVASLPARASSPEQLAAPLTDAHRNDSNFCDALRHRARRFQSRGCGSWTTLLAASS